MDHVYKLIDGDEEEFFILKENIWKKIPITANPTTNKIPATNPYPSIIKPPKIFAGIANKRITVGIKE